MFGIIIIIPILVVFVAIRKRSKSLYCLFYSASLLEAGIIIIRLHFFSLNYFIYYDVKVNNFFHHDNYEGFGAGNGN
jgi:hypothetical protein